MPSASTPARSANNGNAARVGSGVTPYHAMSIASRTSVITKSTNDVTIAAAGIISLGKYTFDTRLALPSRLADDSVTALDDELPRQHRGKHQHGLRHTGSAHAHHAPERNEHEHGDRRTDHRPRDADRGLLVAHGQVAPREEVHQLAITPQVAPVIGRRQARFDDEMHEGGGWPRRVG